MNSFNRTILKCYFDMTTFMYINQFCFKRIGIMRCLSRLSSLMKLRA